MTPLHGQEVQALVEALDDEYRAWATYDQVIADFGEIAPFSNIRDAEARHIGALRSLFSRYQLCLPANPWVGKVDRYPSLRAACEAGVAAEIANRAMYDRLLEATCREDILNVFRNLNEASRRHLSAFQRCAQRSGASGTGVPHRHRRSRAP